MPYYVLFVQFEDGEPWGVHFGDYDKEVVTDELEDLSLPRKKTKIVTFKTATQKAIDLKVESLNRKLKPCN